MMVQSVDRDNIATFVEVVRRQTLAAAARQLEIPKSTVSRRLGRLEEQLGVKLIHRQPRRVTPTVEGRRFYDSVVEAVDALDVAVASLAQSSTEPKGTIRVTAPGDLGRMLLIPQFVDFLGRYPDISLELLFTNRFVDLVQEGVDLALRAGRVSDPNLIARRLMPSRFRLAAPIGMQLDCLDVQQLERLPFVCYRSRGRAQVLRLVRGPEDALQSVELTVTARVNVDDYAAMAELVAAGQGIGLMPDIHLRDGVRAGRLQPVFEDWSLPGEPLHLVYSSREQPERVRLLIDFMTAAFGELVLG